MAMKNMAKMSQAGTFCCTALGLPPTWPSDAGAATKAALHSMTLSMRYQLRETGIQVIEIAPPAVDTELGLDHREASGHGGIPVEEFVREALEGLNRHEDEILVGMAKGLKEKGEAAFTKMNP